MRILFLTAVLAWAACLPAHALEKLDGHFVANKACQAYLSIKKRTNPGGVVTEAGRSYAIKGINRAGGDFVQIAVPDAPRSTDRWVHVDCGVHVAGGQETRPVETGKDRADVKPAAPEESDNHLLALSWLPAFCETQPRKRECRQLDDGLLPIAETRLSIHGLWPQPRGNEYCGVPKALQALDRDGRWSQLPRVPVDARTRKALDVAMPGSASFLDRHEWIKHGTCHKAAGGADEYYDDTLRLVEAINASEVAELLSSNVGSEIDTRAIRAAFDGAFGAGAGERVQVQCRGDGNRVLIQELKIGLRGVITEDASLSDLLLAARPVGIGCRAGTIDPAGLQ